jgi:hypothetical protein
LLKAIPESQITWKSESPLEKTLETSCADIIQAVQAIKESPSRPSDLSTSLLDLLNAVQSCTDYSKAKSLSSPYARAIPQIRDIIALLYPGTPLPATISGEGTEQGKLEVVLKEGVNGIEYVQLGKEGSGLRIPRMFNGFWQMSSPAWGSASGRKIDEALVDLVENGLVGSDMADHYVSFYRGRSGNLGWSCSRRRGGKSFDCGLE